MFQALSFLALAAFLACLALFALAVTKVVAPDGRGHARGPIGGLAALVALFLLCALGFLGLGAAVVAIGVGSLAEWNPVRSIELERTPQSAEGAHASALTARVTLRPLAENGLAQSLLRAIEVDPGASGDGATVRRRAGPDGEFSIYELRLPVAEHELAELEDEAREELGIRLPERLKVELEGPRRAP